MTGADLKSFKLLSEFSDDELDAMSELLEEIDLDAGDILFQEGMSADGLYFVAEGRIKLTQKDLGEIGQAVAGEALGVLSLMVAGNRETTAVAAAPSRLFHIDRQGYHRMTEDLPRAVCKLQELFLKDFGEAVREGFAEQLDSVDPDS